MPDIDGFDFLRVVRHSFSSLPMVLMTGLPITGANFVPQDATIPRKPFEIDELDRVISTLLQDRTRAGAGNGSG